MYQDYLPKPKVSRRSSCRLKKEIQDFEQTITAGGPVKQKLQRRMKTQAWFDSVLKSWHLWTLFFHLQIKNRHGIGRKQKDIHLNPNNSFPCYLSFPGERITSQSLNMCTCTTAAQNYCSETMNVDGRVSFPKIEGGRELKRTGVRGDGGLQAEEQGEEERSKEVF